MTERVTEPETIPPILPLIYSLAFDIVDPKRPDQLIGLIAPLDRSRQSPHCRPIGKGGVIDLRMGDRVSHQGRCFENTGVWAYREHKIEEGGHVPEDGYLFRPKPPSFG